MAATDIPVEFIFPTGRRWAEELDYPQPELDRVPDETAASFAGVANHWKLGRVEPGSSAVTPPRRSRPMS
jgi:arsenite methyltransferase